MKVSVSCTLAVSFTRYKQYKSLCDPQMQRKNSPSYLVKYHQKLKLLYMTAHINSYSNDAKSRDTKEQTLNPISPSDHAITATVPSTTMRNQKYSCINVKK